MSCLLFSVLMNDFCICFRNSLPVLNVDDTTLAISGFTKEIDSIQSRVEEVLSRTVEWLGLGGSRLSTNHVKSEFIVVGKKSHARYVNRSVKVNGKVSRRVKSMKILGVLIDCNLDWHLHVKKKPKFRLAFC
jgi:hypothetical protein